MLGAELEKFGVLSFVLAVVGDGAHLAIDGQLIIVEFLAADPGTADWKLRAGGTEVSLSNHR
jgi:hypothetical protein